MIGICIIMLTIGVTAFAYAADLSYILVFLLFFSPAYGGLVTLDQAVVSDYFGRRSFASIAGLFSGITMGGAMLGPVIAGFAFDVTNSYSLAFLAYAAFGLLAIALLLLLKRPRAAVAVTEIAAA
ncbi:MAG: MFS transporter [Chloroflexi bacterium]|nr:MFS transporter [Chloroflexota bacterium]